MSAEESDTPAAHSSADIRPAAGRMALSAVIAASAIAPLPAFLVGTQAVQMRAALDFDEAGLGLALAVRALTAALLSVPLGRFAQRAGPSLAMRLGTFVAAAASLALALVDTYGGLFLFMGVTGIGMAVSPPATDLWVARSVRPDRQGLVFGLKQAAVPGASLVAGVAVPIVALTLGWRWSFGIAGALGMMVVLGLPPGDRTRPTVGRRVDRTGDTPMGTLLIMALGITLATAPANSFMGFLVSALVEAGASDAASGWLFSLGALGGMVTRIGLGVRADRVKTPQLPVVVGMLATGACCLLLMATMSVPVMAVAAPLVFSTAWGWTGLFYLSMVRVNRRSPAAAVGVLNAGAFVGAFGGPLLFGVVARHSYAWAWIAAATSGFAAAFATWIGFARLRRWYAGTSGGPLATMD